MTTIALSPDYFHGIVSVEPGAGWAQPWRLPQERLGLFPSPEDGLVGRAAMPSGCRIRFATNADYVDVLTEPIEMPPEGPARMDLVMDNAIVDSVELSDKATATRLTLPGGRLPDTVATSQRSAAGGAGAPVYEVWLSPATPMRFRGLAVGDGVFIGPAPDPRRRWVTYGSSITMCRTANSPARIWPGVAAREKDLNLTCLGYGGQCHLDPMVSKVVRDLPADIITLKPGINVFGGGSLNSRTYPAAVIGLVQTVREAHPRTPIGVITSIWCSSHDTDGGPANQHGLSLENYREMTRDAIERVSQEGDQRIMLFEGTDLFSQKDADLMPDGLHPDGDGYELIGGRAARIVLPPLLEMADEG